MFGFLKNKLKEWVSGAKDKLKPEEKEEKVVEPIAKKQDKKEKEAKKDKSKEKISKKGAALSKSKDFEHVDELIEKAKKQKTKEVPKKFDNSNESFKPDTERIKQELATEQDVKRTVEEKKQVEKITKEVEDGKITPKEAVKELEEEREKTEELFENKSALDLKKSEPAIQKKSFLSKLFGKKEQKQEKIKEKEEELTSQKEEIEPVPDLEVKQEKSFFEKVRQTFIYKITEEDFNSLFDDLEMLLLENNVAMEVTDSIKSILSEKLIGKEIKKEDLEKEIKKELKETLNEILIEPDDPLDIIKMKKEKPFTILFFGINGTGKTTSIAKLASLIKSKKMTVALAAADTFRAASIEQISEHAKRLDIPLIKHDYGSDPAAVGFDAIKYAKNHGIDVVLIDTAGRMHTKTNLMSEIEKIVRVTSPDLKIFVAEAIAGNDAIEQAKTFHESIKIDGSILSKADIDEKGGTIISISSITKKPIFYLGTGQNYEDLKLFNKQEFIKSLGLD